MRVLLSGQRSFGYEVFDLLRQRRDVEVVAVSAPLDRRDGRRDRLGDAVDRMGIARIEAGQLRAAAVPPGVDLIVCAHSHDFISRQTRAAARLGAVGYHPSLLPLHRGRDAVRWAVRLRERVTGGTVFWLSDQVDAGPVAAQAYCFVRPGDTAADLWRRELRPMGLRLIGRVLDDLGAGRIVSVPQDEALATWEPSLDAAPLYRPDLIQIGAAPEGYVIDRLGGAR